MKRIFVLLIAALFLLCACVPHELGEKEFHATYLYTGYETNAGYPTVTTIQNIAERDASAKNAHVKIRNALLSYDDGFFRSKILIMLYIPQDMCSQNYVVEKIYESEYNVTIYLKQTAEGFDSDSISGMHILVEMEKYPSKPLNIEYDHYEQQGITEQSRPQIPLN